MVVEGPDVPGVQPAVLVDRLPGGLRVVEVAEHDVLAAQQQLAPVADPRLHAGDGATTGVGHGVGGVTVAHIVATTASVIPNAVTTLSIASPSGAGSPHRSISTTGTTAAPVTASRSEDRS